MTVRPYWRVIRTGITRTVLLLDGWAIKVPSLRPYGHGLTGVLWSFCRGVLANQTEAEMWKWEEMQPRLAPVRRSLLGGIVNIYPRCAPVPPEREHEAPPAEFFGDQKLDNLGLLGGRVVWLDYDGNWNGCPHDRSGLQNARSNAAAT